jgi:hypothetical protein
MRFAPLSEYGRNGPHLRFAELEREMMIELVTRSLMYP